MDTDGEDIGVIHTMEAIMEDILIMADIGKSTSLL